ncbi:MAG: CoA pyrophosphatase [Deltaproteobacteria bacterium]|jgi:hypothetical protein|nr:CoA pyrophosphatase [Deltaproteobacteria bacterium]
MAGMADLEGKDRVIPSVIENPSLLQSHILSVLQKNCNGKSLFQVEGCKGVASSSVMLLLGEQVVREGAPPEVCVILNKRSSMVPQPGDLCCPGGTVEKSLDPYLAKLLWLPGSPLFRWPYWEQFRSEQPQRARLMSLLLAAGLRESWEEMRLNPLFTRFMGPLPAQCLLLFHRIIHPMVGWVSWQKKFVPSWEVEKVVSIPLRSLFNRFQYARYRLYVPKSLEKEFHGGTKDFACFLYPHQGETEILWGVTYKIVTYFMDLLFGFKPPSMDRLPLVPGVLDENYMNGRQSASIFSARERNDGNGSGR